MAVSSPLRLIDLLVAGLFLFCVLRGVQATPGDAVQRVLNVQAESLRAAGCNHLMSRDWSALPPQCRRAVHVGPGNDQRPIGNGSRKPEACKLDHCEQPQMAITEISIVLPFAFEPLPLGSIKPLGWLRDQLQLMADGLPGHEYEFYSLVRDNPWLGGSSEYSPLNEAFPYWFNGLVPLAYGSGDERLKKQVLEAAQYIISHQQEDGWLGPETDEKRRNFWARYPLFLGLAQLVDVEPKMTLPGAAVPAMHRFVDLMHSMLSNGHQGFVWHPGDLFDEQWGRSRAADMILALQWLYEKHPDGNEDKLYDCMHFLHEQSYDWSYWFSEDVYIKDDLDLWPVEVTNSLFPYVHGVNAGQGLKAGAVLRRLTKNDSLLSSTRNGVDWTFKYHGTPSGGIIADERLAGLSPVRGVELCSVVETMFSLSYLYHALGERNFADRCELAAFNALPVMVMPKWWAHQYIAQTNQPISHELTRTPFWNVGPHGQEFGLEPNYPCCTVDFPQGYPKFLSASFARHGEHGIAHTLLGPAEVNTTLTSGAHVHIKCDTNYPFNHVLFYTIELDKGNFWFSFRVPSWAVLNKTTLSVGGQPPKLVNPDNVTGMHTVRVHAGKTVIVYELGADIRVEPRANDTVAIYHGALLYAISPLGDYDAHEPRSGHTKGDSAPPESHDWSIHPISPWALAIDISTLRFFEYPNRDSPLPNPIWAENAPPTVISVLACQIDWNITDGYASNPPLKEQRNCNSRALMVGLRPYGSAKLHMAEIPTVNLGCDNVVPPNQDLQGIEVKMNGI